MRSLVTRTLWIGFAAGMMFQRKSSDRRESALVDGAKRGERAAFDGLVQLHATGLRRFIARRVSANDREDIFQDTLLAVWESLRSFDGSSQFRTWLFAICFHKIQDHWRREQCRPPSEAVVDAEGVAAYLPTEFAGIELREAMREMWEACSPDQRELLRLYYADGLTLKEIAQVLSQNLNTIKYRFYRAHEAAAKMLPLSECEAILSKEVLA